MVSNGREIIRRGYAAGRPVAVIAHDCDSTPGSVKVIAHKMGIRHARYIAVKVPAEHQCDYRHFIQRKHLTEAFTRRVLGLDARP